MTRPVGRTPKPKHLKHQRLNLTFTPEHVERLSAWSREKELGPSEVVREIIDTYSNAHSIVQNNTEKVSGVHSNEHFNEPVTQVTVQPSAHDLARMNEIREYLALDSLEAVLDYVLANCAWDYATAPADLGFAQVGEGDS